MRQDPGPAGATDQCGAAEAAALHGSERAQAGQAAGEAFGEGPGKGLEPPAPGQPSWLRRVTDAVGAPLSSLLGLLSRRIAPLGAGPFSAAAAFGGGAAAPNAAAAALNTATVAAMRRKLVGPNTVRPLPATGARLIWFRVSLKATTKWGSGPLARLAPFAAAAALLPAMVAVMRRKRVAMKVVLTRDIPSYFCLDSFRCNAGRRFLQRGRQAPNAAALGVTTSHHIPYCNTAKLTLRYGCMGHVMDKW